MRIKDSIKQEALFEATIKLVNEIGFAASSVSKIARQAKVSPATIYVYHKNKEELLVSTYIQIKKNMGHAVHEGFNDSLPIRDIIKNVWYKFFEYIAAHSDYFQYTEQFSNSPYQSLVNKDEVEKYFDPVIHILYRGIEQKIIKNVGFDILMAFIVHPIIVLSNQRLCHDFELNDSNIETAFTLAWDAIKL
jgi:AcrR family transcriptional regulator